jgi:hypothetical protein
MKDLNVELLRAFALNSFSEMHIMKFSACVPFDGP